MGLLIKKISFRTKLDIGEIIDRLSNFVGSGSYQGQITAQEFWMKKKSTDNLSPLIKGIMKTGKDQTIIPVEIRLPNIYTIVFFSLGLIGTGLIGLSMFMDFYNGQSVKLWQLVIYGIMIFYYGMILIKFRRESDESKKLLGNLFEAEIIN